MLQAALVQPSVEQRCATVETPVGDLLVEGDASAIRRISFQGGARPASPSGRDSRRAAGDDPGGRLVLEAVRQLRAYFEGRARRFDLPLEPAGTPFQQAVWSALEAIPYGHTESYGELARRIGRPGASRAVGAANGRNPLPIVLPCHRVIGSDGSLTGYGGGLRIKEFLLTLERRGS